MLSLREVGPCFRSRPQPSTIELLSFLGAVFCSLTAALVFLAISSILVSAQAAQYGQWQVLANRLPINPVHAALMRTGKVLMIEGENTNPPLAAIWDPATETASTVPASYTMFCNGMVVLPDGRPFVAGGTTQFPPPAFTGINNAAVYDPRSGTLTNQVSMARGRWYPTATVLSDGRVLVVAGNDENGKANNTVEIFTPNSTTGSWTVPISEIYTPTLYPRMHLLPDGRVFDSGMNSRSKFFDVPTATWSTCCDTNYSSSRGYGTSVLLPLSPSDNYKPQVMIMGGASANQTVTATNTTEIIDLSQPSPKWIWGPNMSEARIDLNATILPSGNVLVTGGSEVGEDASTASFDADLYHANPDDPDFGTFTSAGQNSVPRLYHSNAILLTDATVILTGSNPSLPVYENRVERYRPSYLFNANGTLATRPFITSLSSGRALYGSSFQIQTANAASIASVVMMRPGAPTHSFDMEQRLIRLNFTANAQAGTLTVSTPPNGDIAPPGYYMIFILNSSGVPSVARFLQICPASGCL